MMQMTGIAGIVTQADTIIDSVVPSLSLYFGLIITSVQFISNIFTILILTKCGRKRIILNGNISLTFITIFLGIMFIFNDWEYSKYVCTVFLIKFTIVFSLMMSPIRLYVPEILPAKKVPLANMMSWLGASIATIFTPFIIDSNGGNPYPIFFFFGATIGVCCIYNFLVMV